MGDSANAVEDVITHGPPDGCLLHTYEEVASSLKTDQPRIRNGGRSEFGILVEL